MKSTLPLVALLAVLAVLSVACRAAAPNPKPGAPVAELIQPLNVHYLEIVTPDVDATCRALETLHGVTFGQPVPALGNARTALLDGGGRVGVRAPMHAGERAVVRPYVLVPDIAAAVAAVKAAGGEIVVPPMEMSGEGKCAIYFQGGIEHGLWQL